MMNRLKTAYHKIERFSGERPILFWLITVLISSIPFLAGWKYIQIVLNREYQFRGYEFLILILTPFAIIGLSKLLKPNKLEQKIRKELESMQSVLEKPFEIERTGWANERYKEKYYHSEIIEFFHRYNEIVLKLKKRNSKAYEDLKTRDSIPKVGNDWVPVTSMQVLKSDIELLINRLK